MKVCERLVLDDLELKVAPHLDPMPFAYQKDAILILLERLYSHLERTRFGNSARVMFFDFSSAFNTIQPHLLVQKLYKKKSPMWTDSLDTRVSNQPIAVGPTLKLVSLVFRMLFSQVGPTGAPQGTVLSPFLFTLYTSDCRSESSKKKVC